MLHPADIASDSKVITSMVSKGMPYTDFLDKGLSLTGGNKPWSRSWAKRWRAWY